MADQHRADFYGWTNLVLLFICYCMVYGIVFYGFSVVFPAMIKAMKWARGDASIGQTIRSMMVGFTAPLVAYMINRYGSKKTIMIGGVLTVVTLVLLGTVVDHLWQWTLLWGIAAGFGLSAAGIVPVQTNITYWFHKNRGLAIGIVGTGAAIGGFVAQPLFTWIIKETGQWQIGWLSAGGFVFIGVIGILWLRNKPADYGQHPDGISPEMVKAAVAAGRRRTARTYRTAESWTLQEAIRTRTLWLLMIMFCSFAMPLFLLMAHGVLHMTDLGFSKMQAAYILSLVFLFGGVARFPMGWLADYVEPRWIMTVTFTCMLLSLLIFWQAPGLTALIVAACLFGFSYGACFVVISTAVGNYYSPNAFAAVSGFMFPFQVGFGAIVPVTAGYIHDLTKSYDLAFIGVIILAGIAVVCAVMATPPSKTALAK